MPTPHAPSASQSRASLSWRSSPPPRPLAVLATLTASLIVAFALLSTVEAREQPILLTQAKAAGLRGKTLGVTRRAIKPSFVAATAGKATFALLGAAAMASEGNKIVVDNGIPDPADLIERELTAILVQQHGLVTKPELPTAIVTKNDLKAYVAAQPNADLVLDIRSGGWGFNYYPTRWGTYWVVYSVELNLLDVKTSERLVHVACNTNTIKHSAPPSKEALLDNQAQLLKDVLAALSWNCVQLLAKEPFAIPAENTAQPPAALADPLTAAAARHGTPSPATAAPAQNPESSTAGPSP